MPANDAPQRLRSHIDAIARLLTTSAGPDLIAQLGELRVVAGRVATLAAELGLPAPLTSEGEIEPAAHDTRNTTMFWKLDDGTFTTTAIVHGRLYPPGDEPGIVREDVRVIPAGQIEGWRAAWQQRLGGADAVPPQPPAARLEVPQPTQLPPPSRKGRLPKEESAARRATMLATLRQHPSYRDDIPKLAAACGVKSPTVTRWLEEETQKYLASRAANAPPPEE